ncbi:hypothetical protein [uncultured Microbulbifer sp.]|uniref:hypothetical protein n=1 Tax=uncultured Microbulbifer sp. TaxID=348147 RepID=UPI00261A2AAC|nr:hypothetical protein [uncultured Microbulbifer sp.]
MDRLAKAIDNLGMIRLLKLGDREVRLALLLSEEDWKHLAAPWWRGKSASILGVDLDGNFVLCKSSGDFILWDHQMSSEVPIANNLERMLSMLELDPTNIP